MYKYKGKKYNCLLEIGLSCFKGKWKCIILYHLNRGALRFSGLQRLMPKISQKILIQQLNELREQGLICRVSHSEVPPKVEYFLTYRGKEIIPILEMLEKWVSENLINEIEKK